MKQIIPVTFFKCHDVFAHFMVLFYIFVTDNFAEICIFKRRACNFN